MYAMVGMRRVTRLDTIKNEYTKESLGVTNIAGENSWKKISLK